MFVFFLFVLICLLTAVCLMCRWAEPVRSPDHTERELQRKRHSYLGTCVRMEAEASGTCVRMEASGTCVHMEASGMCVCVRRSPIRVCVCVRRPPVRVCVCVEACIEASGTYVCKGTSAACVYVWRHLCTHTHVP